MKVALLLPDRPSAKKVPLHAALQREFDADVLRVGPAEPFPDTTGYDAVISKLRFRHLAEMDQPNWGASKALKIHWDEDGFWDGLWHESERRGLWTENLPRLRFDLLVVTGLRTQQYFSQLGYETEILHKGFAPEHFAPLGDGRAEARAPEIAMFGQEYLSRVLARRALVRAGVPVRRISANFTELGEQLNQSIAALCCTLDAQVRGGRRMRSLGRRLPELLVTTRPGPEPMLKLFESAASGCATFTDTTPDLEELGFIDGETAILFSEVDELVEKALAYFEDPGRLISIGSRSAALCLERHTWAHRAASLRRVVERRL